MNKIPVINQIIKDKRKSKKINQSDFAKLINKSTGTVKRYDTGDLIPENTLILICDKLGLHLPTLIIKQIEENENTDFDGTPFEENGFYYELIKKYERSYLLYDNEFDELPEKIKKLYSLLYDTFYHDDDMNFINNDFTVKCDAYEAIIENEIQDGEEIKKVIVDTLDNEEIETLYGDIKEFFNLKLISLRKYKLYKKWI